MSYCVQRYANSRISPQRLLSNYRCYVVYVEVSVDIIYVIVRAVVVGLRRAAWRLVATFTRLPTLERVNTDGYGCGIFGFVVPSHVISNSLFISLSCNSNAKVFILLLNRVVTTKIFI